MDERDTLIRSCRSKYRDSARRPISFMRKATMSVIAGNPPADFAQASGKNGMIEIVEMKTAQAPRAPKAPSFLFQNPENKSAPTNHSEIPRNRPAPRMPKTGYSQKMNGPWGDASRGLANKG